MIALCTEQLAPEKKLLAFNTDDLDKIYDWCKTWQMRMQLNIEKCPILRCTQSSS